MQIPLPACLAASGPRQGLADADLELAFWRVLRQHRLRELQK